MDKLNRMFIAQERRTAEADKELNPLGMKIPMWYKSQGSVGGPNEMYMCGWCGQYFESNQFFEYAEHYVKEHPFGQEKNLEARREARRKEKLRATEKCTFCHKVRVVHLSRANPYAQEKHYFQAPKVVE